MSEDLEYEAYEKACEERRKENDGYIREFDDWLMAKGLSDKTIQRHIDNVHFYLNEYLLREDAYGMEEGCHRVDDFLGYFFIRKCMWSTPATIKQNAASFKKFYKCMLEAGHIEQESYDTLLATIKSDMPLWLEDCEKYNDSYSSGLDDFFGTDPIDRDLFHAAYDSVARSLGFDFLLGDDEDDLPEDDEDLLTRDEAIQMLTMALLYLTSQKEGTQGSEERRAPTSPSSEVLDLLCERGWISCNDRDDTVSFTPDGEFVGQEFLATFGFDYLAFDEEEEDADPEPHGWRLLD